MPTEQRLQRLRSVLARRQNDVTVVLDNIHDAHNASAILRSADGFGVGRIALLYTDQPLPSLSKGVSGFTRKWMTFENYDSHADCLAALRDRGEQIVATQLTTGAPSHLEIDWTQSVAIVLGNEHEGCTPAIQEAADATVTIPMQGMAQSFNVSVAASIILAELYRQRSGQGMYRPEWNGAKEALYRSWLARETVR
jgi:tRNA (guanosine-2'-O-)-methyltransferase